MVTRATEDRRIAAFTAAALAILVAGGVFMAWRQRALAPQRLAAHTRAWFDSPRAMAKVLLDRHGPPSLMPPNAASWYGVEPFKRITVHGDSPENYLEEAVGYQAKEGAVARLRELGLGVRVDQIREEISARGNSEALNLLTLNLANDVASGGRTPREAREFYRRTLRLAASGKSSPYMERLLFEPYRFVPQERTPNLIGY